MVRTLAVCIQFCALTQGSFADELSLIQQHASQRGKQIGSELYSQVEKPEGSVWRSSRAVNMHVFYNVYNENDDVTLPIIEEQLDTVRNSTMMNQIQKIHVVTIGKLFDLPPCSECNHLAHFEQGFEELTLQPLYEHCLANPADRVAYMHSKGSYHSRLFQHTWRRHLMTMFGPCDNMEALSCNVCSSRFSPLPHHHTVGNMWIAECGYVQKLLPPSQFQEDMESFVGHAKVEPAGRAEWEVGTGRYANEHWVHSHPTVAPCDLCDGCVTVDPAELPEIWVPNLQKAPRYTLREYNLWDLPLEKVFPWRLNEWHFLYAEVPDQSMWNEYYGK